MLKNLIIWTIYQTTSAWAATSLETHGLFLPLRCHMLLDNSMENPITPIRFLQGILANQGVFFKDFFEWPVNKLSRKWQLPANNTKYRNANIFKKQPHVRRGHLFVSQEVYKRHFIGWLFLADDTENDNIPIHRKICKMCDFKTHVILPFNAQIE